MCEIIVIGASLGGLNALEAVLPELPRDLPLPVVIVQHRSRETDESLLRTLARKCPLDMIEPQDKQPLESGVIYLAPSDYHLLVERGLLTLSTEAPVRFSRPSIDALFQSAADAYGLGVLAVILTGAGDDGARGVTAVRRQGGQAIAQDPATAEAPSMPRAAISAGADQILPLSGIAGALSRAAQCSLLH